MGLLDRYWKVLPYSSRSGLGGESVLLEKGFEVSNAQAMTSVSLVLLSSDWDAETQLSCLPLCCHAFHHEDNGPNLWNSKKASIKHFSYKSCHGYRISSQQQITGKDRWYIWVVGRRMMSRPSIAHVEGNLQIVPPPRKIAWKPHVGWNILLKSKSKRMRKVVEMCENLKVEGEL